MNENIRDITYIVPDNEFGLPRFTIGMHQCTNICYAQEPKIVDKCKAFCYASHAKFNSKVNGS